MIPDSKVDGANMGPIWGRQDPGGPHVGPMNLAIWDTLKWSFTLHFCAILVTVMRAYRSVYFQWEPCVNCYCSHVYIFFSAGNSEIPTTRMVHQFLVQINHIMASAWNCDFNRKYINKCKARTWQTQMFTKKTCRVECESYSCIIHISTALISYWCIAW